jgi:hypothetical protein
MQDNTGNLESKGKIFCDRIVEDRWRAQFMAARALRGPRRAHEYNTTLVAAHRSVQILLACGPFDLVCCSSRCC